MADSPVIDFYFDVVSPYSYLASTQVPAFAERTGAIVRWRPIFLGAVMKATGNAPPAQVKAKGVWMRGDLERWAEQYGVPFSFPSSFPAMTILHQRCLFALARQGEDLVPLAQTFFAAHWGAGQDIADPAVATALIEAMFPGRAEELIAASQSPELKAAFRQENEAAVALGLFGAPSFVFNGELYFGNDRLGMLEARLRGTPAP